MATVLLVRHGRTTANSSGLLAGWTEGVGLDDTGREQVAALGTRLAEVPLVRVVASPLQRCQETATALLADRAGSVETDEDLGECRYGAWTGRPLKELLDEPLWPVVQDHPSAVTFPPDPTYANESLPQLQARAVAAIRRHDAAIEQEHGARAVWAAVSHGDVIKAVLADALGMHLDLFQRIQVAPASVSVVRYTSRRPFVLRSNDVGGAVADVIPAEREARSGEATPGGSTGAETEPAEPKN